MSVTNDIADMERQLLEQEETIDNQRHDIDRLEIELASTKDRLIAALAQAARATERAVSMETLLEATSNLIVSGLNKHQKRMREFDDNAAAEAATHDKVRRPLFLQRGRGGAATEVDNFHDESDTQSRDLLPASYIPRA